MMKKFVCVCLVMCSLNACAVWTNSSSASDNSSAGTKADIAQVAGNLSTVSGQVVQVAADVGALQGRSNVWNTAAATVAGSSNDWNTAFSWGNHAGLYLGMSAWGSASNSIWSGVDAKQDASTAATDDELSVVHDALISSVGNISNSYVVVNETNSVPFSRVYAGRPHYDNQLSGDDHLEVRVENVYIGSYQWGISGKFDELHSSVYDEISKTSYFPPESGWSDNSVVFVSGNESDVLSLDDRLSSAETVAADAVQNGTNSSAVFIKSAPGTSLKLRSYTDDNNYGQLSVSKDGIFTFESVIGGAGSMPFTVFHDEISASVPIYSPLEPLSDDYLINKGWADTTYASISLTGSVAAVSNDVIELESRVNNATNEVLGLVADAAQVNSRVITATNVNITYTWPATNLNGTMYILEPTNNWHSSTGSILYATADGSYLVDVKSDPIEKASPYSMMTPTVPVYTEKIRLSNTSIVFRAFCNDANSTYWAKLTNAVPQTYDLEGMPPNSITNDGAGVIQLADNLPANWWEDLDSLPDGRLIVNLESLLAFGTYCTEQGAKRWSEYTASGAKVQNTAAVTIDKALIQSGGMTTLQSGNYICQSYVGGDWWQTTEGNAWYVGPNGSRAFGFTSTNKALNVTSFNVSDGVATLDISTNGVAADPEILTAETLTPDGTNGIQWVSCPSQTMTNMGSYWRGQCDASADSRYFMVVSAGGECRVISKYPLVIEQGIADESDNILNFITMNINGTNVQFIGRIEP